MPKRVGLIGLLLVSVLGSGAVAREPSASPEAQPQRVEFADEGIAIEVPAGWESVPYEGPGHEAAVAVFHSASGGTCAVSKWPSDPSFTIDYIVDVLVPTGHWADLPGGYTWERVPTAAGETVKVTYPEERIDLDATFWNAFYFFPAGERLYMLQCNIDDGIHARPGDDWLSMALTFEFLPAEE